MRQTSYGIAQVLRGTPRPRDAARFLAKRVVSDTDEPGIGSAPCSRMAGSSGGGRVGAPLGAPGAGAAPRRPGPPGRKGLSGGRGGGAGGGRGGGGGGRLGGADPLKKKKKKQTGEEHMRNK